MRYKRHKKYPKEQNITTLAEKDRENSVPRNTDFHSLNEKIETDTCSFRKDKRKRELRRQINNFKQEEKEIYDPLSKDMDKDGTIDRYDVDFRDSKVSYRTLSEEEKGENKGKKYCKSNFEDEEFTRNKEDKKKSVKNARDYFNEKDREKHKTSEQEIPKAKKDSEKTDKKFKNQEKKLSKLQHKKDTLEKKWKDKKKATLSSKSAVVAVGAVNRYLESGKEDNAGVDAAHKVTDRAENVARKLHHHGKKKHLKRQKKLSKLNKKIEKQEKKLFFQKNMEELKKSSKYQNTSRLRQFFKRRQYKKQIQKKYKDRGKNRIKKSFIEHSKRFAEFVKSRGKKIGFLLLMVVGIFFMLSQAGTMLMNLGTGMVGNTISTTYLSSEDVLRDINQEFSSLEQALQEEMESVEEHHPGYDEYIIKGKEKISHDVHELLSYITARFGVVKEVSAVESELQSLFHQMYTLTYKEEIEIRYRTVTSANGESHEEAYEYKKLIVTLGKREMDSIIREIFQSYPDNVSHYETLLVSKGNMELAFGSGSGNLSEIINNPDFSNPGLEFNEESVKRIVHEAEKHIGKRYVFGANGPGNFDCSSFVCWVYTHSKIKNMPRTTAWGIYKNYCNPVSPSEAKAGDIIFFKGTYDSGSPISHVGIYVGGGYMIHAGDPIKYARIDTPYWKQHFYGFGRISGNSDRTN